MTAKPEARAEPLPELLQRVRDCRICLEQPSGRPLPHPPRPVVRAEATARLCIAGQAPGTRVHASGVPFTDPSGDRLREWMNVDAKTFYDSSRIAVIPMGFCFPGLDKSGGDLPPRRECARTWHDAIYARMAELRVILAIGAYAQRYHLGDLAKGGVTATVGSWREIVSRTGRAPGPVVFPLPHPSWRNNAWLKRNGWFEAELLPVLRDAVADAIADPSGIRADRDWQFGPA